MERGISWFVNKSKDVRCDRERGRCWIVLLPILNSRYRDVYVLSAQPIDSRSDL